MIRLNQKLVCGRDREEGNLVKISIKWHFRMLQIRETNLSALILIKYRACRFNNVLNRYYIV